MIFKLDHPLTEDRAATAVWGGGAALSEWQATVPAEIVSWAGQLLFGGWRKFPVADRDGMYMDGRVCVQLAIITQPAQTGRVLGATVEPAQVVRDTLAALGTQPYVIPGAMNRIASFVMKHLLPRQVVIKLMGKVLRDMYVK